MKTQNENIKEVIFRKIWTSKDKKYAGTSIPIKWFKELGFDEEYPIKLTKEGNKIIIKSMAEIIKNEIRVTGQMTERVVGITTKTKKILKKTEEKNETKKEESKNEIKEETKTEKPEDLNFEQVDTSKIMADLTTENQTDPQNTPETITYDIIEVVPDDAEELGEFDWKLHDNSSEETEAISLEEFNKEKEEFDSETD